MLRHLVGLLTGVVLAPVLWFALAWSAEPVATAIGGGDSGPPLSLAAVAVLMSVGIACGLLAGARISPLAAFCCGGLMLGYALWPVLAPGTPGTVLPGWIPADSPLHPLASGLLLALPLGTLLFISALLPSRWRPQRDRPAIAPHGPPAAPAAPATGESTGEGPLENEPAPPAKHDRLSGGLDPDSAPWGDPDKTTTPLRRRRIGRPRWSAKGTEPAGDTREFQRNEHR